MEIENRKLEMTMATAVVEMEIGKTTYKWASKWDIESIQFVFEYPHRILHFPDMMKQTNPRLHLFATAAVRVIAGCYCFCCLWLCDSMLLLLLFHSSLFSST